MTVKAALAGVFLAALVAVPFSAQAQGVPGGAAHGFREGGRIAGPIGAVVGTAVGGVVGGIEGVLGVNQRYAAPGYDAPPPRHYRRHRAHRTKYRHHRYRRHTYRATR